MNMFISLVDGTVAKRKERFSVYCTIDCGYRVVRLDNTVIVKNSNLFSRAVSLKPIRNIMRPNTFYLVVLIHCSILIP